jgi:hypothetical protein
MAVSKLSPGAGANDFNIGITGLYTVVTFTKEYSSGGYSIVSSVNDTTLDIYAFNADGTSAGYTSTKSFTATKGFNKMVILGGTDGDLLSFTFKQTFISSNETAETGAGPVVTSVSPTDMPKVNDTITVTGRNFASDVSISFTNTGYTSTVAKSIVRTSATSLIVTRPDTFPVATSAYTITATNPGVNNPIGSSANILANSVTAGNSPVWSTNATLPTFTRNVAYTTTLVATDSDTSSVIASYTIVSGSAGGFTLASTSGVLSGTSTSSTPLTFTARATDSGGNFVDRAFTIPNAAPTWVTTGALTSAGQNIAYSFTLNATDDSGATPTFSLASGSIPAGLSLSSGGVISGTPTTGGTSSFVVTATDANGGATNSGTLTIYVAGITTATITSSQTWTSPSNLLASVPATVLLVGGGGGGSGGAGCGGSGGGGAASYSVSLAPSTGYSITIGGGGGAGGWYSYGGSGAATTAFSNTQNGGNPGGPSASGTNNNGGSSGNGNAGGTGNQQLQSGAGCGGGGGGAGGVGGAHQETNNRGGNPGAPFTWSAGNGSLYGGGSAGSDYDGNAPSFQGTGGAGLSAYSNQIIQTNGTANTGGAAGAAGGQDSVGPFRTGGSGVVIVRYYS